MFYCYENEYDLYLIKGIDIVILYATIYLRMFNNKIISISGNARCGKDTLGKNMAEFLNDIGINTNIVSFADELKKSVDGFLIEQTGISAFTEEDKDKSLIRPFLVCWGTEVMRSIDDNVWINKLKQNLKADCVNIITDLRFENELNWVKGEGGYTIYLNREGIPPANQLEKENNVKISILADLTFGIGTFDDQKILKLTSLEILEKLINKETFELWKATCPL